MGAELVCQMIEIISIRIDIRRTFIIQTVGCVFPMVIWSEFRMGKCRNNDHKDDVPYFTVWMVTVRQRSIRILISEYIIDHLTYQFSPHAYKYSAIIRRKTRLVLMSILMFTSNLVRCCLTISSKLDVTKTCSTLL